MEFFGKGTKAPPKNGATELLIEPDEIKAQPTVQSTRVPSQSADIIEDVAVKPARKPVKAQTLDLESFSDVENVTLESAPQERSRAKAAPRNATKPVLDLFADDTKEASPEAPPTPDSAEPVVAEVLMEEPPVIKLVAEEVDEVPVSYARPNPPSSPGPEQGVHAPAESVFVEESTVEAGGLKMNFKKKGEAPQSESQQTESPKATGMFGKDSPFGSFKKAGNPFARKSSSTDSAEEASKPLRQKSKSKAFGGLFGAKKDKVEAPQTDAQENPQKSNGFKGFSKFKAKVEKAPKFKSSKTNTKKHLGEQYIAVSLTVGSEMFWRVTDTSIEQVDSIDTPSNAAIASFTKEDVRIYVDTPQSNKQATELAIQALEEKPRLINLSKSGNAIFTTPAQRLAGYKVRVGPGLPLLQTLLQPHFEKNKEVLKDVISGFLLLNTETKELLVVLYHFDTNGNISPPEVTANPTDVHMTLRQFANSQKVDPATADILLFRNEELLGVGTPKHLYPADADFIGLPVTVVMSAAAVVTTVAALGGSGFAAQEYLRGVQLQKKGMSVKEDTQKMSRQVHDLLSSSVASFAKHQTLEIDALVKQAQQFWVPRSTVAMTSDLNSQTYRVTLPLMKSTATSKEGATLLNAVNSEQVMALANMNVPENCTKQSPSVPGTLDVIQLTINCETAPGPFNRYRAN